MLFLNSSASAMPANEAWASASPMKASPLVTTKAPTTAQTTPTISVASSARCMNGKASGSARSRGLALMRSGIDGELICIDSHQDEVRAVSGLQISLSQHVGRFPLGDDLAVEQDRVLEPIGHTGQVAGGHDDHHAPLAKALQQAEQIPFRDRK